MNYVINIFGYFPFLTKFTKTNEITFINKFWNFIWSS